MKWFDLARDRYTWKAEMNLPVPKMVGNFFISCGPFSFVGKTLLHGLKLITNKCSTWLKYSLLLHRPTYLHIISHISNMWRVLHQTGLSSHRSNYSNSSSSRSTCCCCCKNDAFPVWVMWCHLSMHMTCITGISMQDSGDCYSSRNKIASLTVYSNKYS
jgi:hypothetical protein